MKFSRALNTQQSPLAIAVCAAVFEMQYRAEEDRQRQAREREHARAKALYDNGGERLTLLPEDEIEII